MNRYGSYIILLLMVFGCHEQHEPTLFSVLEPEDTGVDFSNTLMYTDTQNILEYLYYYNGGGVGVGDINNDGLQDIYLTANQGANKLYLNKGNMRFEDITEKAGVAGQSDWNTGVAMADVNGDGFVDIYVCAVVGIHGFEGENELFINNGDDTFTEQAGKYGLNYKNYSTAANFFDYDLDGDLDLYLLNHAIHTQDTFGKANLRNKRNEKSGDKLLKNENGLFTDVSEEAGIFGGVNGYGLSVSVSDFDMDGYPDIYVCNDFHEDDYYYLNNGNGTFSESLKEYFGHVSQFSMGSDVSDVNGDGFPDLMTLDMLPYDEKVLKMSGGDYNVQNQKTRIERHGYHYQYARNMLQVNQQSKHFTESALLSGVAATDWSWSILFADYNQDGKQDIFVSNGIPKRPNDLDYINFISDSRISKMLNSSNAINEKALSYMPDGAVLNCFFEGTDDLQFINQSDSWSNQKPDFSNGSAYVDLDNDGDLDLITNNIDAPVTIYQNQTDSLKNYVKLKFNYTNSNHAGIGTKAFVYANNKLQYKELFPQRGFQSSSEPTLHFGLGDMTVVDSIRVIWPNQTVQTLQNVKVNQTLVVQISKNDSAFDYSPSRSIKKVQFEEVSETLGLDFVHEENEFLDFNYQKLIPYQVSDRKSAVAIGDLNQDGKEDIYFGNAHGKQGAVYIQKTGYFEKKEFSFISADQNYEDASATILDFDLDGLNELLVVSGGGQADGDHIGSLKNRLYKYNGKDFERTNWVKGMDDTSVIKASDYDNDGDQDIFIGNASVPNDFGKIPPSYILKNEQGKFIQVSSPDLNNLGMVRDAIWTDFNNDGHQDLLVVGEWMQPTFLENRNGILKNTTDNYLNDSLNGLWRSIFPFDIDSDGDIDYLLGNWGINSKLSAGVSHPLLMYYDDFDHNGQSETIIAYAKSGSYYTLEGLDMLSQQLVSLTKKKFPQYKLFAGKTLKEVFDMNLLNKATKFEVHTLCSGVLINQNGQFDFEAFDQKMQTAPINTFTAIKGKSGEEQVVCAGNYFGVSTYHGRFDGFSGAVIDNTGSVTLGHEIGLDFFQKSVTQLKTIQLGDKQYLMAIINNDKTQVYEVKYNTPK